MIVGISLIVLAVVSVGLATAIALVEDHRQHALEDLKENYNLARISDAAAVVAGQKPLWDAIFSLRGAVDRLEAQPPSPPAHPALSFEEKTNLRTTWNERFCPSCGNIHYGACRRIARQVTERKAGQVVTVTTEYWPDGQWQLPEWHLTVGDVFEDTTPIPQPQQGEPNAS